MDWFPYDSGPRHKRANKVVVLGPAPTLRDYSIDVFLWILRNF